MRTIKFRGKRIDNREWEYGDLMHDNIDGSYIFPIDAENLYSEYKVNPETVGQFTGLHDKEGKEIYEGDIIYSEFNDGSHANCLVGWNDSEASFGIMDDYEYKSKLQGYDFPKFDSTVLYSFAKNSKIFKIIGNIHDNSELIN